MTTSNNDNQANASSAGSMLGRIKKSVYKADYFLLFILFTYGCVGYLLLPKYQYKLSPDGISYIPTTLKRGPATKKKGVTNMY